jgi:hypothetical protein
MYRIIIIRLSMLIICFQKFKSEATSNIGFSSILIKNSKMLRPNITDKFSQQILPKVSVKKINNSSSIQYPSLAYQRGLLEIDSNAEKYYIPIQYYSPLLQNYEKQYIKVSETDKVETVAVRAAKLTRGIIPPQRAMLFLNDENLPPSKRLLPYFYNSVQNGGILELDYKWKFPKPCNPYVSSP